MTHASALTAYVGAKPCLGLCNDLVAYVGDAFWHVGSFRTAVSFRRFVRRFSLTLRESDSFTTPSGVPVKGYRVKETVEDHLFWERREIPEGARRFRALSNGSIVWCWWKRTGNRIDIWRPNPNARKVYRPLDLDRHIAFSRRNGTY